MLIDMKLKNIFMTENELVINKDDQVHLYMYVHWHSKSEYSTSIFTAFWSK